MGAEHTAVASACAVNDNISKQVPNIWQVRRILLFKSASGCRIPAGASICAVGIHLWELDISSTISKPYLRC